MAQEVVLIFAGVNGYLDSISIEDIKRFKDYMISTIMKSDNDILATIAKEGEIRDDIDKKIHIILQQLNQELSVV